MQKVLVLINEGTNKKFVNKQIESMKDYFSVDAPKKFGVKKREFEFTIEYTDIEIKLVTVGTNTKGREAKGADNIKRHLNVPEFVYDAVYFVYDGTPTFNKKGWYNAAFAYKKPLYEHTQMVQVPDNASDNVFMHEWMHVEAKIQEALGNNVLDQMDKTLVNGKWIPYYKNNSPLTIGGNYHQTFKSLDLFYKGSFPKEKRKEQVTKSNMKPLNQMTKVDNFPTKIIVHHTGGTDANPLADTSHHTFETIQSWHTHGRGWENIGYHWVIEKSGRVVKGRPETYHAAAARGHNSNSVHIVLSGNFDATLPTKEQVAELKKLMKAVITRHPIEKVIPHRLVANKTCYGMKLSDTWAQELLDEQDQVQCDANMKALAEKVEKQESTIQLLIKLIRQILGLK